jgi:hypothetical protein
MWGPKLTGRHEGKREEMGSVMRINLLLVMGLLAVSARGFAADAEAPVGAALYPSTQDSLTSVFTQDLTAQPLGINSTQAYKIEALNEFVPVRSESPSVFGEVKNIAGGAVKGFLKSPLIVLDGIKTVIGHFPGVGTDSKSDKVETVYTLAVPSLELKVGNEDRHTFFEREFAKRLANHRTAEDYGAPTQEELRGKKVLKILLLQMDFGSDK